MDAALAKVGMMPFHPWVDDDLLHGAGAPRRRCPRSRWSSAPPRTRWSCSATRCRRCPRTSRCRSSRARRSTSASPTRSGCAPRSRRAAATSWKRSPTSSCTCRTSCWRAVTKRAATRVFRYRFTWEAPVRRACHALDLPFTFGTLDVSTWREFAGADGDPGRHGRRVVGAHAAGVDVVRRRRCAVRRPVAGPWPVGRLVELGLAASVGARRRRRTGSGIWLGDARRQRERAARRPGGRSSPARAAASARAARSSSAPPARRSTSPRGR